MPMPMHGEGSSTAEFEAFFVRYERQITSYLWRLTGDEQIASELAQETFLACLATLRRREPLRAAALMALSRRLTQSGQATSPSSGNSATDDLPVLDADDDPASSDHSTRFAEQDSCARPCCNCRSDNGPP